jgi:histidinol-phosphate/aromatic aminotransferase/cobyric acid decarboxylase-like protein
LAEHQSKSALDVVEHLMSRGIIVRAIKSVNSKTLRITVGTDLERERLLNELEF